MVRIKSSPPAKTNNVPLRSSPIDGEIISEDLGYDSLIEILERHREMARDCNAIVGHVARFLANETRGDKKTRRLMGDLCTIKVEMPSRKFEQSILKEVWNSYPDLAKKYLRIQQLAPILCEVDKLEGMKSKDKKFETFRLMLINSETEPTSTPFVTLEKKEE